MSDPKLLSAEQELAEAQKELALDLAQAAVDAAGIVDPTPISDGIGAAMSLARGDFLGAGLSLISMVPYVGDALGKTAKGTRAAAKMNKLRKRIAALTAQIKAMKKAAKMGDRVTDTAKATKELKGSAGAAGKCASSKARPKPRFRRNLEERRKALLRDAEDPRSGLTQEQRDFIRKHDGRKVPPDCEVSHEVPLYTEKTLDGKKKLDVADNMKTMNRAEHRARHKRCGDQFHDFPP